MAVRTQEESKPEKKLMPHNYLFLNVNKTNSRGVDSLLNPEGGGRPAVV